MNKKLLLIGLGLIVILLLWSGISIYPDWLWFENLGFSPVFLTMLLSKFGFGFLVWLFLISIVWLNLYIARRLNPDSGKGVAIKAADDYATPLGLSNRTLNTLLIAVILILSLYVATKGALRWDMVLRYFRQQPFGGSRASGTNDKAGNLLAIRIRSLTRRSDSISSLFPYTSIFKTGSLFSLFWPV